MYGISTVASQVESVAFLSNKLPQGISVIFVQGAIAAPCSRLWLSCVGKWRATSIVPPMSLLSRQSRLRSSCDRILAAAFVFLTCSSATNVA